MRNVRTDDLVNLLTMDWKKRLDRDALIKLASKHCVGYGESLRLQWLVSRHVLVG